MGRGLCVIALALAALAPSRSAWAQGGQKRVLVLYSTGRDAQISTTGERELPQILDRGLARNLDYYSEFIDAGRFQDPGYQEAFRDFLGLKYAGQRFDIVIAMLDAAIEFAGRYRDELFPETPVVFFALNPVARRIPNSAGIIGQVNFDRTLTLITQLQPDVGQVFVVSGAAALDRSFEIVARAQFRSFEHRFTFTYLSGLPTTQLNLRLAALPQKSVVYYLLVNQDGAGETFQPLEYLDSVSAVANRPVYSWVDSTIGHGVVGGTMQRLSAQVDAVGDLAVRVLRGEPAERLGTVTPDLHSTQVDWRQLQRWGIGEGRIPAGASVLLREPSAWDRYKIYIVEVTALLVFQTALIVGLLIQAARRRRAEAQVRAGQSELRASHDRIHDLGIRLLTAQDAERSRIARELHDDISQQLALLAMDLEVLSGSDRERHEDGAGLVREALDRAQQIARSVHALSHRLHPAKLRLIGLVAALSSLQRELSHPGLTITFSHDNVPEKLPQDLTLCLFRIVQEALQNVMKHSGAHDVSVSLHGSPDALAMTIADDGVGFDVTSMWGRGLGLISMSERLESVGGTLTIRSSASTGTRLEVTVPLRAQPATMVAVGLSSQI